MKLYRVVEPDYDENGHLIGEHVKLYNRQQILDEYFNFWLESITRRRPDNFVRILQNACIEDWVTVNWAVEVDSE